MLGLIATRFALKVRNQCAPEVDGNVDIKPALAAMSLIVFAMVRMLRVKFVSEIYFAWALIPAAAIFIVVSLIAAILLKDYARAILASFASKATRILRISAVGLCIFICAFLYSSTALATINCIFDGEPTPSQCTVIDKKISSGAESVTQFEIKISVDDRDLWVSIPTTEYHNLEIGDTVTLHYYKGALGFAYWKYSEKAEVQ